MLKKHRLIDLRLCENKIINVCAIDIHLSKRRTHRGVIGKQSKMNVIAIPDYLVSTIIENILGNNPTNLWF